MGSLMKLLKNNLFRPYFIEKNTIRRVMEGSLREVIEPSIPKLIYFNETYVKHFSISDEI